MGNCCSANTTDDIPPVATREVPSQEQSSPVIPQGVRARGPSSQQRPTKPPRESPPQVGGASSHERPRVKSAPQNVRSMNDVESFPLQFQRSRAKSSVAPSDIESPSSPINAGESENGWMRIPSLTMIRALKGTPQTTDYEPSRSWAARFDSAARAPRTLQVCSSTLSHTS